jgi:hypothetical protein
MQGRSSPLHDGLQLPKRRKQQRHIYLEIMGSMSLKIMLITMILTCLGCIVMSVFQSKNLSEIVGDDETCLSQFSGQLCIDQFESLNCTAPNNNSFVPQSSFKGSMMGISPYNRFFAIETRFEAPNLETTRNASKYIYPSPTFNMTIRGKGSAPSDNLEVIFEVKRQM